MNFSECAGVIRYLRLFQCRKPTEPQRTCRYLDQRPGELSSGLATLRRKRHDIMHTPMGYVCQGRLLHQTIIFLPCKARMLVIAYGSCRRSRNWWQFAVSRRGGGGENTDLEYEWKLISQTEKFWINTGIKKNWLSILYYFAIFYTFLVKQICKIYSTIWLIK